MTESDLRAELADVAGPVPNDAVDWDALHRRIATEAVGPLRALRLAVASRPWWAYTASWARAAVPLAVAASVVATVALHTLRSTEPTVLAAVQGDLPTPSLANGLVGKDDTSWLMDAAVGGANGQ